MNVTHLRAKGWSEAEIADARAIFLRAQQAHPRLRMLEHATFWMLLCTLAAGTIIVTVELVPVLVLATLPVALPIVALLGSCMGLLLVHAMHDLRLERAHQHTGVALLVIASIVSVTAVLESMQERLFLVQHAPPIVYATAFAAGLVLPYLAHWRLTHDAA
jgi:hypothetical protein